MAQKSAKESLLTTRWKMNPTIEYNGERDRNTTIGASRNNSARYNDGFVQAHPAECTEDFFTWICLAAHFEIKRIYESRETTLSRIPASCETPDLPASRYGEIRTIQVLVFDRSREPLLQVTPVNQVPEAVTTHGIRGQNTRGQIYRLYGRLVSCSALPPAQSLPPSPATFYDPRRTPSCLLGMHAASIRIYTRCNARVRITPTILDNLAQRRIL